MRDLCRALSVPGFLAVLLIGDDKIVFWQICDAAGNFLPALEGKATETQRTCNGGETVRFNAYLKLDDMVILSEPVK